MAAKKKAVAKKAAPAKKAVSAKPKNSGQGYVDRYKKTEDKAYTTSYNIFSSSNNPYVKQRYAGAKGMAQFAKDYKSGVAVGGDYGPKSAAVEIRRNSSGDLGSMRAASRAKAKSAGYERARKKK